MQNIEKQFEVLELLAQHEEAISHLYSACANAFQENKDFWQNFAGEEKIHAHWLRDLKAKIETRLVYLDTEKFTGQSISNLIKWIEEEREKIENGKYSEKEASFLVLDIEKALIESGSLNLFSTDSAELKHFLNFLVEETEKHRKILENKTEEFKN